MSVEILNEIVSMSFDSLHSVDNELRRLIEDLEGIYRKNIAELVVETDKLLLFGVNINFEEHPRFSLLLSRKVFVQDQGLINVINNLLNLSSAPARSPLYVQMKKLARNFLINEEFIRNRSIIIVPNLTTWELYMRDPLYEGYYDLFKKLNKEGVLGDLDAFYGIKHLAEFLFKVCYFNLDLITGDQVIADILERFISNLPAKYRLMVKFIKFKKLPSLEKFERADLDAFPRIIKELKSKDIELIHRKVDPSAIKRYLKMGKIENLNKEFGKFGHNHMELSCLKSIDKTLSLLPLFRVFGAYYMPKTSLFDLLLKKVVHDLRERNGPETENKINRVLKLSEISRQCESQAFFTIEY
ncbi:MAG: hypothetical protein ACP6IP_10750 [Candidatus Njordarchaeia archaeon]